MTLVSKDSVLFDRLFQEFNQISPHRQILLMKESESEVEKLHWRAPIGWILEVKEKRQTKKNNDDTSKEHSIEKRNPGCMKKCLERGVLHPAQCHFLC